MMVLNSSLPQGNFFSLPNGIFELELSPSAFLVYSYLRQCADRKTYHATPATKPQAMR